MSSESSTAGRAASDRQSAPHDASCLAKKPPRKRRRWSGIHGLLVLNLVLVAVLGTVLLAPQAIAQFGSRSTYALISSHINGMQSDVVFILDTASSEMIAISYNPQTNAIERLGYRRLSSDGGRVR